MVMTTLLQYLMQVVSLMMVGHLGRLPLSAVAIATALTNVWLQSSYSEFNSSISDKFIVLCFHVPICWILIFKLELGDIGAAVAFCLSNWHNVILLGLYVKYSSACEATRMKFSKETFLVIGEFFRFAVPAAVMVCLTITTLHFTIPYGLGAVARHGMFCNTRVSNELGAGNSQAAQIAVWAVILLAVIDAVTVSTVLFRCRYVLGEAYSNDKQVVGYVAVMTPLICISIMMDSLQGVLSGLFLVFFHVFLHGFLR
ncbi:hypothetical protein VitviT2T_021818 [Vitis vinifera]|uniref:Uncharacterized protein n=1 Tax=Vitis vinifera TaxID=29760 RepID=A0ABY9D851_VITVI|nr:hypothetical protein VitviT2T_021818 [Vitis vinifera]